MNSVELFGSAAATVMVVSYALESRGSGFVLLFASACAASSGYAVLINAWPFALVEAIWSAVALHRWYSARSDESRPIPESASPR